ncbi:MAG TPA: hypothetical protein VFH63_02840 [candidate division Zixibacteria bacterium]|nr:hypothetical protein [candidate division Zixibacteria bacterium]
MADGGVVGEASALGVAVRLALAADEGGTDIGVAGGGGDGRTVATATGA